MLAGSTVPFTGVALGLGSVLAGPITHIRRIRITDTTHIHTTAIMATRIGGALPFPMFGAHPHRYHPYVAFPHSLEDQIRLPLLRALPHNLQHQVRLRMPMQTASGTDLVRVTTRHLGGAIPFLHPCEGTGR